MKSQSLSKNLIFQYLYQGLILVIPLIVAPYLTRTLQETALGVYSYTNSVAYYFVLAAMLGINRHGQRTIAQHSGDEVELRKQFWSLFTLHMGLSAAVTVIYVVVVTCFIKENVSIYLIQTFYVASAFFDITWLYYGLENFKSVVIRNALVKVIECALIFILVKSVSDLWVYTLIVSLGFFAGQVVMLPQAIQTVKPIRFSGKDVLQHVGPLLIFSISIFAVSLYTVFDKTLLGLLSNTEDVAFFEYSNKIINVPKTFIITLGTVMFPRACRLAAQGDIAGQKRYMTYSFLLSAFIGMGSIFGLLAVGDLFSIVYFGESFAVCGNVMKAMSPLVFVIGFGDIIRTQYMIPNHMDFHFNFCIILNAVINVALCLTLIPKMGIYGAIISTTAAELFGLCYQLIVCRKFIDFKDVFRTTIPFVAIGLGMFLVIKVVAMALPATLGALLVEILVGLVVYGLLTLLYLAFFEKELLQRLLVKTHLKKAE